MGQDTTIHVNEAGPGKFDVTVRARTTTTHRVTVPQELYSSLTGGRVSGEELVRASFLFLLEREPNTSILREFDLPVIARYFPDYEATMRERMSG